MRISRITPSYINSNRYHSTHFGSSDYNPQRQITQIDKIRDYDEEEEAMRRALPEYPEGYFDKKHIHPQGMDYIPPEHPERYIFNDPNKNKDMNNDLELNEDDDYGDDTIENHDTNVYLPEELCGPIIF